MLYMIEMRIHAGQREKALNEFETRGPNRNPGVKFRGAWIGAREDMVYALVDGTDEAAVTHAVQTWNEHCESTIHPVINIENY